MTGGHRIVTYYPPVIHVHYIDADKLIKIKISNRDDSKSI